MATPYEKIQKSFHSRIVTNYMIIPDLEEQYFLNALGDFELHLYPLDYSEKEIKEDVSRSEINLLGALMYKHYLARKIDEVLQLQNIVGKDISLTGIGQSKQEYGRKYEVLQKEISELFNGLKQNTFDQED